MKRIKVLESDCLFSLQWVSLSLLRSFCYLSYLSYLIIVFIFMSVIQLQGTFKRGQMLTCSRWYKAERRLQLTF